MLLQHFLPHMQSRPGVRYSIKENILKKFQGHFCIYFFPLYPHIQFVPPSVPLYLLSSILSCPSFALLPFFIPFLLPFLSFSSNLPSLLSLPSLYFLSFFSSFFTFFLSLPTSLYFPTFLPSLSFLYSSAFPLLLLFSSLPSLKPFF
jgi:hypothetical protein